MGDFKANVDKVKWACSQARKKRADIILFPELTLTGYPPEDLLFKNSFIKNCREALKKVATHTRGLTVVIGFAERKGKHLYNSAALICDGGYVGTARKMLLPNYGVFDEKRYFTEGDEPVRFSLQGVQIGLTICEDIWAWPEIRERGGDPARARVVVQGLRPRSKRAGSRLRQVDIDRVAAGSEVVRTTAGIVEDYGCLREAPDEI